MNSDCADDRRFLEWKKNSESDPEVWARFRVSDDPLGTRMIIMGHIRVAPAWIGRRA